MGAGYKLPTVTFIAGLVIGSFVAFTIASSPGRESVLANLDVTLDNGSDEIILPASLSQTRLKLTKGELGVDPNAPTFAEVLAQNEEKIREQKAKTPQGMSRNAMVRLSERQCSTKQGRAKEACVEQLIRKCSRKVAEEQLDCFLDR